MNNTNKKKPKLKVVVLGSTGMIGTALIKQLLDDERFEQIDSFVRKPSGIMNVRLREHIVDFDLPHTWEHLVSGDALFSCLGTTLKQAGSKQNQYKIDVDYQYTMAKIAASKGVEKLILVSSAGANEKSGNFYLRMKGELDSSVQKLGFKTTHILRPGQLYGERQQNRPFEKAAVNLMFFLNKLGIARKYRPIHANDLAKRMIQLIESQNSGILTLDELF